MPHNCQNLVINCLDFRLQESLVKFLTGLGLTNDYDLISVAGGALALARPREKRDRDFILEQIEITVKKHGINRVSIINHEDCGAYGGSQAFASAAEEKEKHAKDLKLAKEVIGKKFSQIKIALYYAQKGAGNFQWSFEKVS